MGSPFLPFFKMSANWNCLCQSTSLKLPETRKWRPYPSFRVKESNKTVIATLNHYDRHVEYQNGCFATWRYFSLAPCIGIMNSDVYFIFEGHGYKEENGSNIGQCGSSNHFSFQNGYYNCSLIIIHLWGTLRNDVSRINSQIILILKYELNYELFVVTCGISYQIV